MEISVSSISTNLCVTLSIRGQALMDPLEVTLASFQQGLELFDNCQFISFLSAELY